jgi:hypothetical protein
MKNVLLVFSLVLSLLVIGCGGNQPESSDAATGAGTPAAAPAPRRVIGDATTWKNWANFNTATITDGGVVLSDFREFLIQVNAADLQGRKLVYEAQLLEGEKVPMRMQINWKNQDGGYVSTDMVLAYPTTTMGTYSMNVYPPKKAAWGDVYGIVHDQGPKGKILLKSVYLD